MIEIMLLCAWAALGPLVGFLFAAHKYRYRLVLLRAALIVTLRKTGGSGAMTYAQIEQCEGAGVEIVNDGQARMIRMRVR